MVNESKPETLVEPAVRHDAVASRQGVNTGQRRRRTSTLPARNLLELKEASTLEPPALSVSSRIPTENTPGAVSSSEAPAQKGRRRTSLAAKEPLDNMANLGEEFSSEHPSEPEELSQRISDASSSDHYHHARTGAFSSTKPMRLKERRKESQRLIQTNRAPPPTSLTESSDSHQQLEESGDSFRDEDIESNPQGRTRETTTILSQSQNTIKSKNSDPEVDHVPLLHATVVTEQMLDAENNPRPADIHKYRFCLGMAIVAAFVVVAITVTGTVCGSGLCTRQTNNKETPVLVPTQPSHSNIFHHTTIVLPGGQSINTSATTLDLANAQGLNGTIPMAQIILLTSLTVLQIPGNDLSGPLPSELGLLTTLSTLDISSNALTGTLPTELGLATALTSMDISGNRLTGHLLSELGRIPYLTELNLSSNGLRGSIPTNIGLATKLTLLDLSNNLLTGNIPTNIDRLSHLRHLNLSTNQLTSAIPKQLDMPLESLDLSNNTLNGTIPSYLGFVSTRAPTITDTRQAGNPLDWNTVLSDLRLHHNELSGWIPTEFGLLTNLIRLSLQGNSLQGTVPASVCALKDDFDLAVLTVGAEEVECCCCADSAQCGTGPTVLNPSKEDPPITSLPPTLYPSSSPTFKSMEPTLSAVPSFSPISFLSSVPTLLSTPIPTVVPSSTPTRVPSFRPTLTPTSMPSIEPTAATELVGSNATTLLGLLGDDYDTNMTELKFDRRNVSGTIPTLIGELTALSRIRLFKNELSGPIPTEVGNLVYLESFNAAKNRLTGFVPSEIGLLTNLTELALNQNSLTEFLPTEIGALGKLENFQIDNNQLSSIPTEIGLLTSLRSLSLHENKIDGLPSELWYLSALEKLSLQGNSLFMTFPTEMGLLKSMEMLNVRNNDITSTIPTEIGALTNLKELDLDKNALVGSVPSEIGLLTNLSKLILRRNNLEGVLPTELGLLTSLIILDVRETLLTGTVPESVCFLTKNEELSFVNVGDVDVVCPSDCCCSPDPSLCFQ